MAARRGRTPPAARPVLAKLAPAARQRGGRAGRRRRPRARRRACRRPTPTAAWVSPAFPSRQACFLL